MLSAINIAAIAQARHGDPFAALGLHTDSTAKLWLRAMLPGATSVAVIDAATGQWTRLTQGAGNDRLPDWKK